MYGDDLARSEVRDLQGAGELYLRRQCSLGVLRIRFDRAATRMRLFAPDCSDALRDWVDQIDAIERHPATEQFGRVGKLLDAFDRWSRGPLRLPEPEPPPPPPPPVLHLVPPPDVEPDPEPDPDDIPTGRTPTTLVPSSDPTDPGGEGEVAPR